MTSKPRRRGFECQTLKPLPKVIAKKVILLTSPEMFPRVTKKVLHMAVKTWLQGEEMFAEASENRSLGDI